VSPIWYAACYRVEESLVGSDRRELRRCSRWSAEDEGFPENGVVDDHGDRAPGIHISGRDQAASAPLVALAVSDAGDRGPGVDFECIRRAGQDAVLVPD